MSTALRQYRLQFVTIAGCAVFLAVLWSIVAAAVHFDRVESIESQSRQNENLTRVLTENVSRTIRAAEITLNQMVDEYLRVGKDFDLTTYSKERGLASDPSTILAILDETGDLILANIPLTRTTNFFDNPDVRYTREHDSPEIFISAPRQGVNTKKWTIYLARRINKPDGSFGGTAEYGLDPIYFSKIFRDLDLGEGSAVALIGKDGIVRAREDDFGFSTGQDASKLALFTKYLPTGDRGSFRQTSSFDNVDRIVSYRAMKDYPLVVLVGTPVSTALARVEKRRFLFQATASLATVVILILCGIAVVMVVRDRRVVERLRHREERYSLVEDAVNDGIWDWNILTGESYLSPRWKGLLGFRDEELANHESSFFGLIYPEDRPRVEAALDAHFKRTAPYDIEVRLRHKNGNFLWFSLRGEARFGATGRAERMVGSMNDITRRKDAEAALRQSLSEKETLLREVHHRVKNNLQIIASLLYFESQKLADPAGRSSLADVRRRLNAMILVHEKLYRSEDLSRVELVDYVRSLTAEMERSYQGQHSQVGISITGSAPELPIEQALPCGMIVAELTTNALKYAFPNGRSGTLAIEVSNVGGRIGISVRDDGVGMPEGFDPSQATSFGWRLIRSLTDQIGGTVALSAGQGTAVTVSFPHREAA